MGDPPATKPKKIYGVPVLPVMIPLDGSGAGNQDDSEQLENNMEDRASIGSTSSATTAAAAASTPVAPPDVQWNLKHIDFLPAQLKKEDEYEKFPALLDRANRWLAENRCAASFSIETMTWMTVDKPVYSDNGVVLRSMSTDKKTRVTRGLRIWYFVLDDTFYSGNTLPQQCSIRCRNYFLEGKQETVQTLLTKLNTDMFKKPFLGKILKVETLHVLQGDHIEPDLCFWKEQPDKDKHYSTFLRVFLQERPDQVVKYGDIGIQDFIPKYDQRTTHNQGYEVYADIWKRAARWVYHNPGYRIIGSQSLFVKYKKECQDGAVYDRLNFKEHGSAHGSLSSNKTEYVQILRVVYSQPATKEQLAETTLRKLFYRSFAPARLKKPSGITDEKEELSENSYEDMRMTEERVNSWLHFSGAKVVGVETVPVRLRTGGQDALGAEATYVWNSRDKNPTNKELWRYTVRLHLDGEFKEVPVTWSRHIVENAAVMKTSQ